MGYIQEKTGRDTEDSNCEKLLKKPWNSPELISLGIPSTQNGMGSSFDNDTLTTDGSFVIS